MDRAGSLPVRKYFIATAWFACVPRRRRRRRFRLPGLAPIQSRAALDPGLLPAAGDTFRMLPALHGTLLSSMHFGAAPVRKVDSAARHPGRTFRCRTAQLGGWNRRLESGCGGRSRRFAGALFTLARPDELPVGVSDKRIELRGVSWVFRAANYHDYYQATLAVAPGGGYEFRRSAVIGGVAEAATVRAVPPASPAPPARLPSPCAHAWPAMNSRFHSTARSSIPGPMPASPAGGIGFVGAPEERARLYWVKVTPIGHTSKEYSKR
jgi:hypothetical protein